MENNQPQPKSFDYEYFFNKHNCAFVFSKNIDQLEPSTHAEYFQRFAKDLIEFITNDDDNDDDDEDDEKNKKEYNLLLKFKTEYINTVPFFLLYESIEDGTLLIKNTTDSQIMYNIIRTGKQDKMHMYLEYFDFKGCIEGIPVFELSCGS